MHTRHISFCEKVSQSFEKAFHYIQYTVITPICDNKSWSLLVIGYLTALGYYSASTGVNIRDLYHSPSYTTARVFGATLRNVFVPTVILPTFVAFASRLQRSGLSSFLPLDHRVSAHKLISYGILGASFIHSVGHYFYQRENYLKQPGITGMLMLLTLVVPLGGVYFLHGYKPNLCGNYSLTVKYPHQLGAGIFLILFGFHTQDLRLLPYSGAISAAIVIHSLYEFFSCRHVVTSKTLFKIKNTNFIVLGVTVPPYFCQASYLPGQYAMISIPVINGSRHPITIASMNDNEVFFVIKETGHWTTTLASLGANPGATCSFPVILWGPYGSPLNSFYNKTDITVIAAGSGMTPFLAFTFWLLQKNITIPHMFLHVSLQKIEEAIFFLEAFSHHELIRLDFLNSVDFYITRQEVNEIKHFIHKIDNELYGMRRFRNIKFTYFDKPLPENNDLPSFFPPHSLESIPPVYEMEAEKEVKKPKRRIDPHPLYERVPSLGNLGLFTIKNKRDYLDIKIHCEQRMVIDKVVANSLSDHIFTCGPSVITDEVKDSAMRHHKKYCRESF